MIRQFLEQSEIDPELIAKNRFGRNNALEVFVLTGARQSGCAGYRGREQGTIVWRAKEEGGAEAEVHKQVISASPATKENVEWKGSNLPTVHAVQLSLHVRETMSMLTQRYLLREVLWVRHLLPTVL